MGSVLDQGWGCGGTAKAGEPNLGTMNARAMRKGASRSSEHWKPFTTEQLCDIWEKIRSDTGAHRALDRLDAAGFRVSDMKPMDGTLKHPNWADYIAALPLLSNRPSSGRIHKRTSFRKYWPLVRELRRLAAKMNMPFVAVEIFSTRDYPGPAIGKIPGDLLKAASMLEHVLSWDYLVQYRNNRNAVIAELRWAIRERTGRPHDRDLKILINAAFRAAGNKEGFYIHSTTLDRIEKRQKESRVKANRRMRRLIGASAPSLG